MKRPSRVDSCVLVVEDDTNIRELLVASLSREISDVESARDGEEAMQMLREKTYSVCLLDLMMPKVSGWDLTRWLRRNPSRRPRSIIVVTAADRGVFRHLDPEMVNAIMIKPFDAVLLAAYVRACCERDGMDRRRMRIIR